MKIKFLYECETIKKKPAKTATVNIRRILRKDNRNFQSDRAPITKVY